MTYNVVPSESFECDYDEALDYLIRVLGSHQGARHLISEIEGVEAVLAATPFINSVSDKYPLRKHSYREHFVFNYVVVYRIEGDAVYLLRLFHQSQNYEKLVF